MRLQQAQLASVMTWEPVADEDQSTKARVRVREVRQERAWSATCFTRVLMIRYANRLDRGELPETPTADGNLWAQKVAWLVLVFDLRSMASADLLNTRAFHSKLMLTNLTLT
jgi:hypothetical protein